MGILLLVEMFWLCLWSCFRSVWSCGSVLVVCLWMFIVMYFEDF